MPLYEHVFLARQDASTQQVEELTTQMTGIVEQAGGKVTKTENWGVRSLTYRMNKNRKAHFVLLNIDAPSAAVAEIERQERISEDVIRYLSIRVEELTAQMTGIVEGLGGKVTKTENWGVRSLTYRMNKNRKAHFVLMNIDAPSAAVNEIERQERISEDVIRYLTVRVEEHEEGPSAMMRKADRDRERDDRGGGFRGDREGGFRGDREGGGFGGGFRGDRGPRRPRDDEATAAVEE